jgi:hypothetical protein
VLRTFCRANRAERCLLKVAADYEKLAKRAEERSALESEGVNSSMYNAYLRICPRPEQVTANKRCVSGASLMNNTRTRELYSSPNGDRWHLCKDASGRVFVLHQANIQADKPPTLNWATSSQEDMAPSNKPYSK